MKKEVLQTHEKEGAMKKDENEGTAVDRGGGEEVEGEMRGGQKQTKRNATLLRYNANAQKKSSLTSLCEKR